MWAQPIRVHAGLLPLQIRCRTQGQSATIKLPVQLQHCCAQPLSGQPCHPGTQSGRAFQLVHTIMYIDSTLFLKDEQSLHLPSQLYAGCWASCNEQACCTEQADSATLSAGFINCTAQGRARI